MQSVGNPRYSENAKDANLLTSVKKDEYTARGFGAALTFLCCDPKAR